MPSLAAVVATYNRPGLLNRRALASIANQTRPPDILMVVDDSAADIRPKNRAVVDGFAREGVHVIYLENRCAPGASGAWNTALHELWSSAPSAFVAILDDDDMWEPELPGAMRGRSVSTYIWTWWPRASCYNRSGEQDSILLRSPESLNVRRPAGAQSSHTRKQTCS